LGLAHLKAEGNGHLSQPPRGMDSDHALLHRAQVPTLGARAILGRLPFVLLSRFLPTEDNGRSVTRAWICSRRFVRSRAISQGERVKT
jgi:hypothetical protein